MGLPPKQMPYEDEKRVGGKSVSDEQVLTMGELMEVMRYNPTLREQIESSPDKDQLIKMLTNPEAENVPKEEEDSEEEQDALTKLVDEHIFDQPSAPKWDEFERIIESVESAVDDKKEEELDLRMQLFSKQ